MEINKPKKQADTKSEPKKNREKTSKAETPEKMAKPTKTAVKEAIKTTKTITKTPDNAMKGVKTARKTENKKSVKSADSKTTKKISEMKQKVTENKSEKSEMIITDKKSVMFVASEGLPFIKTGGLADVIGSLPKELAKNNNYDVSVIMPMYSQIDDGFRRNFTFIGNFNVALSWRNQYCGLFSLRNEGVTYYFIDNEYYFKRDNVYGCYDDGERFAFFSKAVIDSLGYMDYFPDILNCNDWQSAAAIIYLKTLYAGKRGFSDIKTVFTIHNIEYQGKLGMETSADIFGFPENMRGIYEFDGCLNLMKGAIVLADKVNTVSPTYSEEIKNSFFACGLENIIKINENKISGILNGIDLDLYNPESDVSLFKNYGASDLSGKKACKRELQKMLGLPERDVPVIALISRLVSHKGLDLVKCVTDEILYEDVQFVLLGKGDNDYENFFRYIESRYRGKFRAIIAFNKDMASKIYSGADMFLMPSRQEPCGLSQMIACRYGTIPVVRKTGGLADSIKPFNEADQSGNGFVFDNYNAHEMLAVIKNAVYLYGNGKIWDKLVYNAINSDFGWSKSARLYENLYDELIGK